MLFETSIPYRITRNMEEPISRTFWFDAVFTCGAQSVQSLFVDHLKQLKINYIRVLGKLWFFYRDSWCSYDYEAHGNRVNYYLLEYIQK